MGNPEAAVLLVLRGGGAQGGSGGGERGEDVFVVVVTYLILSYLATPSPVFLRVFRRHAMWVSAGLSPRLGILHVIRKYTLLLRKCAVKFDSSHPDEKSI